MLRYGSGITLQVKIGLKEDFIGSVQESVLTRDAKSGDARRTGSQLGRAQSPPTRSPTTRSPPAEVVVGTTTSDGLATQNFMNFIENAFESTRLIEQHLVISWISIFI